MVEETTLEKILDKKGIRHEVCSIEEYADKKDNISWSLIDKTQNKVYYGLKG